MRIYNPLRVLIREASDSLKTFMSFRLPAGAAPDLLGSRKSPASSSGRRAFPFLYVPNPRSSSPAFRTSQQNPRALTSKQEHPGGDQRREERD